MGRLERIYQSELIPRLERAVPDAIVRKHDIQQGWPDLLLLAPGFWAMLETKREAPGPDDYEPNQEEWIEHFAWMSFSACIYPANEQEVIHALQQASRIGRSALLP